MRDTTPSVRAYFLIRTSVRPLTGFALDYGWKNSRRYADIRMSLCSLFISLVMCRSIWKFLDNASHIHTILPQGDQ